MAAKNNIRSMRFSDEMTALIEQQIGDTFTQKFESLVTRCVWELPKKEQQIEEIEKRIAQERKRLYDLQQATRELQLLEQDIKRAQQSFGIVERRAKQIAEMAEKNGL